MNAGRDREAALRQAWENAKLDGQKRYVWQWNKEWWIEKTPPGNSMAGVFAENVIVVDATGTYTTLSQGDQRAYR